MIYALRVWLCLPLELELVLLDNNEDGKYRVSILALIYQAFLPLSKQVKFR